MKIVLILFGITLISFINGPSLANADCDILNNQCGSTKKITVEGHRFGDAVARASESHGKKPYKKLGGNCSVKAGGGAVVHLPPVVTTSQACEIKVLTGGKSHSKMMKRCAIWKWYGDLSSREVTDGVGGKWEKQILKRPKNKTRQKMWHIKLRANRPPFNPSQYFAFKFKVDKVQLKVPASSSLNNSSNGEAIRNYCFQ